MATSVSQPAAECSAQLTIKGAFLNAIGKVNILAPLALSTFPHCLNTYENCIKPWSLSIPASAKLGPKNITIIACNTD